MRVGVRRRVASQGPAFSSTFRASCRVPHPRFMRVGVRRRVASQGSAFSSTFRASCFSLDCHSERSEESLFRFWGSDLQVYPEPRRVRHKGIRPRGASALKKLFPAPRRWWCPSTLRAGAAAWLRRLRVRHHHASFGSERFVVGARDTRARPRSGRGPSRAGPSSLWLPGASRSNGTPPRTRHGNSRKVFIFANRSPHAHDARRHPKSTLGHGVLEVSYPITALT